MRARERVVGFLASSEHSGLLKPATQRGFLPLRAWLAAGLACCAVVLGAWSIGPGLFTGGPGAERVLSATVVTSAPCTQPGAAGTVRLDGESGTAGEARLDACGYAEGERVTVAAPGGAQAADPGDAAGPAQAADAGEAVEAGELVVRPAAPATGEDWHHAVGLALLALGGLGGAAYIAALRGYLRTSRRPGSDAPR